MANQVLIPRQEIPEELNLLPKENLDTGLWQSLKSNIHDTFFPEKLPPLQLTSRPVRVREIWGDYNYRRRGGWLSLVIHGAAVAGLIAVSIAGAKVVQKVQENQITLV